jgi:nitroimidazol reductase NimA-like FMN-containing flavoprotein (pyridoxamine 5'-phosphate oxidase superfamily)
MGNRRSQIELTDEEITAFLDEEKVAIVTSFGPRGWPHSMPLWFVAEDGRIRSWTFRKSQKVKNLERDSRATVLVEAGYDEYSQLRGVMYEAETVIHDDPETVLDYARKVSARYSPDGAEPTPEMIEAFRKQAPKRVVLEFVPVRTVSWDHRKLGGVY